MPKSEPQFPSPPPEPFKPGETDRTVAMAALEHAQHALETDPTPAARMAYAQLLGTLALNEKLATLTGHLDELNDSRWRAQLRAV